jgi:signal transduction histidine kinase
MTKNIEKDCILSALQDITAHKEAERKIQEALMAQVELNKLKSNFVTLASHEFRTPLTTILSSAFLIENYSKGENKEKIDKHLSRIKGAITSLTSILDDFLSLTKIEEGKIEAKPERINLKELMEGLCQMFKPMTKPGQTIVYQHKGETTACSDPVLLTNIVNNLVSNAIKYSRESTSIHITSHVNNSIHLSVKDHGIGISKEDQGHLFERFYRASNSGNIQGTGLGLHIMKHYVDMLHGDVKVNSTPGEGTEVTVTLENPEPQAA